MNLHLMVAGILGRLENDTNCRVLRDSRDCGGDHLVALYFDRLLRHASAKLTMGSFGRVSCG